MAIDFGVTLKDLIDEINKKSEGGSGSGSANLKYVMPYQGTGKTLAPEIVDTNTVQFTLPKKITVTKEYTFDYYTIPIDIQVWENSVQVGVGITIPFDTRIEKQADNQVLNCTVRTTPRGTGTETQQNTYRITFDVVSEDDDNIVIAVKAYTNFTTAQTISRENGVYFSASRAMGWYGVYSGGSSGESANIDMPIIRFASASTSNGSMICTDTNPLRLTVEIVAGQLNEGDELQLCKRKQVITSATATKKYKLRPFWVDRDIDTTKKFLTLSVVDITSQGGVSYLYSNSGGGGTGGHSVCYLRIARYFDQDGNQINRENTQLTPTTAKFSNIVALNISRNLETQVTKVW